MSWQINRYYFRTNLVHWNRVGVSCSLEPCCSCYCPKFLFLPNAMAHFRVNFSILSGDLKQSDIFCFYSKYSRGWGSWSSRSRSIGIYTSDFLNLSKNSGVHKGVSFLKEKIAVLEILRKPYGQAHAIVAKPGLVSWCTSQSAFRKQLDYLWELLSYILNIINFCSEMLLIFMVR